MFFGLFEKKVKYCSECKNYKKGKCIIRWENTPIEPIPILDDCKKYNSKNNCSRFKFVEVYTL